MNRHVLLGKGGCSWEGVRVCVCSFAIRFATMIWHMPWCVWGVEGIVLHIAHACVQGAVVLHILCVSGALFGMLLYASE